MHWCASCPHSYELKVHDMKTFSAAKGAALMGSTVYIDVHSQHCASDTIGLGSPDHSTLSKANAEMHKYCAREMKHRCLRTLANANPSRSLRSFFSTTVAPLHNRLPLTIPPGESGTDNGCSRQQRQRYGFFLFTLHALAYSLTSFGMKL